MHSDYLCQRLWYNSRKPTPINNAINEYIAIVNGNVFIYRSAKITTVQSKSVRVTIRCINKLYIKYYVSHHVIPNTDSLANSGSSGR